MQLQYHPSAGLLRSLCIVVLISMDLAHDDVQKSGCVWSRFALGTMLRCIPTGRSFQASYRGPTGPIVASAGTLLAYSCSSFLHWPHGHARASRVGGCCLRSQTRHLWGLKTERSACSWHTTYSQKSIQSDSTRCILIGSAAALFFTQRANNWGKSFIQSLRIIDVTSGARHSQKGFFWYSLWCC